MPALRYETSDGVQVHAFDGRLTIGRDPSNDIALGHEPSVSRRHARISGSAEAGYVLEDSESRNGVMIERGGSRFRVEEAAQLLHGDVVLVGSARLAFDATVHGSTARQPGSGNEAPAPAYVPEATRVGPIEGPPPEPAGPLPSPIAPRAPEVPPDAHTPTGGSATTLIALAVVALVVVALVLALTL